MACQRILTPNLFWPLRLPGLFKTLLPLEHSQKVSYLHLSLCLGHILLNLGSVLAFPYVIKFLCTWIPPPHPLLPSVHTSIYQKEDMCCPLVWLSLCMVTYFHIRARMFQLELYTSVKTPCFQICICIYIHMKLLWLFILGGTACIRIRILGFVKLKQIM